MLECPYSGEMCVEVWGEGEKGQRMGGGGGAQLDLISFRPNL